MRLVFGNLSQEQIAYEIYNELGNFDFRDWIFDFGVACV